MTEQQASASASKFLRARGIGFEEPSRALESADGFEVIFHAPGARDPQVAVVDPPDVRVIVSKADGQCKLVEQM